MATPITKPFPVFIHHYKWPSRNKSPVNPIMLKIQMLEQILTKESVNEECRLSASTSASASSSGQQTPVDEDGRSLSTASFRTHKSSSSSQNSTQPSTPIAVMTGFVHTLLFTFDVYLHCDHNTTYNVMWYNVIIV